MHLGWKTCSQGSLTTISVSAKASKQITQALHCEALLVSSSCRQENGELVFTFRRIHERLKMLLAMSHTERRLFAAIKPGMITKQANSLSPSSKYTPNIAEYKQIKPMVSQAIAFAPPVSKVNLQSDQPSG